MNSPNNTRARTANGRFAKTQTAQVTDAVIIEDNERFTAFKEMFGFDAPLPTARYPIAGFVMNLVVCAIGGYAAGYFATYVGVASVVMSGIAFIGICAYVLAMVIGFVATMRAGAVVGKYIAYGQFEDDYQAAKGWVCEKASSLGNLFRRTKEA